MIDKLFQKYINGECSKEERNILLKFFSENLSAVENYFSEEEWELFLKENSEKISDTKSDKIYGHIQDLIKKDKLKKRNRNIGLVIGILILSVTVYQLFTPSHQTIEYEANNSLTAKNIVQTKANVSDNNIVITLSDSSLVTLYPGSQIKYDSIFTDNRNIELIGKAKFDVIKNSEKRFVVKTGEIYTIVTGTNFIVDASNKDIEVTLIKGSVIVKLETFQVKDSVFLEPGHKVIFNSTNNTFSIIKPEEKTINQATPKTNVTYSEPETLGLVSFKNTSLKTVLDQISSKYGVEIEYLNKKVENTNISIAVDTTQSIEIILRNISAVHNLQLSKVSENKFLIK